jgi:hypothetical protein
MSIIATPVNDSFPMDVILLLTLLFVIATICFIAPYLDRRRDKRTNEELEAKREKYAAIADELFEKIKAEKAEKPKFELKVGNSVFPGVIKDEIKVTVTDERKKP